MKIHVVSAKFAYEQWRAVMAFQNEETADNYADELYEKQMFGDEMVLDSRVDEVNLI